MAKETTTRGACCSGSPVSSHGVPAISRRQLLESAALGAIGVSLAGRAASAVSGDAVGARRSRLLIRNATVLTLDASIGNLPQGDLLTIDGRIAAVGVNLSAETAEIIDASNMIAMPGFIDTHRHMWEGGLRHLFPNFTLADYFGKVLGKLGPVYRPEDAYIGDLISALGAIDAGVTTILDWSSIQNSPEHSDAVIQALTDSRMRAVFAYGHPDLGNKPAATRKDRFPEDIKRLRRQYFSTDDQLLTLAFAADGPSFATVASATQEWLAAREVGARITVHYGVTPDTLEKTIAMYKAGLLRSDTTYIHCTDMAQQVWRILADTGGTVSISCSSEMQMGIGTPAIQDALDHGIRPSLSVDVETSVPNDMFTQMRTLFALQRSQVFARILRGDKNPSALLDVRDLLDFAITQGARATALDRKIGSLAPGKQADFILLRKDRINVIPMTGREPIGAVVLGMDTGNVDSVFVAGKALKRRGQLLGVDLKALAARAAASQEYLLSRAAL